MNIINTIQSILFLIVGIITSLISLRFLLSKEFFSYHREAIRLEWHNIEKKDTDSNYSHYENGWIWHIMPFNYYPHIFNTKTIQSN